MKYRVALTLSSIFLLSYISFCQTSHLDTKVSISAHDETIENILKKIEQVSTLYFSYKGDLFKNESKKTISFDSKSIKEVLTIVISKSYIYFLHGDKIIIKSKSELAINTSPTKMDVLVDSLQEITSINSVDSLKPTSTNNQLSAIELKLLTPKFKKVDERINASHAQENRLNIVSKLNEIKQFKPTSNVINENVNVNPPKKLPISKVKRPKKVGLVITPFLDIDKKQRAGIGLNEGIMLEFPILKRLSLSSGILLHHQRVDQPKQDMVGLSPDSLLVNYCANLFILEIPVTFRYNLTQSKNEFFMAVSMSSTYIHMLDHSLYNFEMEKKGELYKLGIFNVMAISIGIEREISNYFSIQVEPCIKFSLVKLGPQNVDFTLVGITLRFNRLY